MCFKQDMEEFSKMCEQSSNDNCHIGVDKIKGNDEHILMLSDLVRMQPCHFEVCGNYGSICEICMAEAERKEEKSTNYRLLTLKPESKMFKTSMICRKCKSNNVEILALRTSRNLFNMHSHLHNGPLSG